MIRIIGIESVNPFKAQQEASPLSGKLGANFNPKAFNPGVVSGSGLACQGHNWKEQTSLRSP
jgi:hypothetical protein